MIIFMVAVLNETAAMTGKFRQRGEKPEAKNPSRRYCCEKLSE